MLSKLGCGTSFVKLRVFENATKHQPQGIENDVENKKSFSKTDMKLRQYLAKTALFSAFAVGGLLSVNAQDDSRTITNIVRLPVTVTYKNDLVSGLKKEDFVIFEDKKQQKIETFLDETSNPPVYVGVLMDTSPSTAGKLRFEKEAAKNFIYTVTRLRKDKVAFMTFDHEIKLRQDFTDKLDLLDKAVEDVKQVGNQTALYDAIYRFCDEKLRTVKGRRVIVVITDGDDTFARADLEDVIDIAQRTETTIFAISTKAGFLASVPGVEAGTVRDAGDKELARMASETGGQVFFTGDITSLEKAFTRISKELRSQYILVYQPDNQEFDGKERKLEVRLADKDKQKKFNIRTKPSYKASRDSVTGY